MASLDHLANSELNSQRIQRVEKCFGTSGIPLSLPGRVLLGEGILTKICRKKPKARKFFLFNDVLVYGSILIDKTKYTNQRIIPLQEVNIEEMDDETKYKNAWIFYAKKKSFIMLANTSREKEEWMLHIAAAIKELKRKQSVHEGPLSAEPTTSKPAAAMFVPDHEALECMLCKKTRFTTFNRRHHCRNCGIVVCSECSKYFVNIPTRDQGRERVCYKCYQNITENYGDQLEHSSSNGNINHTGLKNGDSSMLPTMQEIPDAGGAKDGFQSDAFSDDDSDDDEVPSSVTIHAAVAASAAAAAAHDHSSESNSKVSQ